MSRQELLDGTEVIGGYARAVRFGNQIHVSGTTSANRDGQVIGTDLYEQTRETYAKIARILADGGASMTDVVRVVIYVTDISDPSGFVRAHEEVFDTTRPAATMVEVSKLIGPDMLVEIEAYALLDEA